MNEIENGVYSNLNDLYDERGKHKDDVLSTCFPITQDTHDITQDTCFQTTFMNFIISYKISSQS